MNVRNMLSNVRTRCGTPRPQQPSDKTLLLLLSSSVQRFLNKTSLTGNPWAVDELSLVVTATTEDYALPISSSFGRPIQVRSVYPTNPSHIEYDVDFFMLGDINHEWGLPKDFGGVSYDGSPNTAQRIAFFRKSGTDQVYARVMPIPAGDAEYSVLYQIGLYGETVPLDETPVLPEHHTLIELWTAVEALPHCRWTDDRAADRELRGELALAITANLRDLERDFKLYIANMSASNRPTYRSLPFEVDG